MYRNDIHIDYDPTNNPGQLAFHKSKAPYKAMVGALGSGKSSTGCFESIVLTQESPGTVGLIARYSLPELKTTTMDIFFSFLPTDLIHHYNKTDRILEIKAGKKLSMIHFGPLDSINRYKSANLGFYFIDEADATTLEMWRFLTGRLRRKDCRHVGMLATNPTTTSHWIYKLFVEEPPEGYEIFRSKTYDNERYLPKGYITELKRNFPSDWQRRYLDGEFGILQTGDPVYPDFSPDLHVKPIAPMPRRHILRGWDFGYNHPCVVFAQFDELQRLRVFRTMLGKQEDLYIFADRVIRYTHEHFAGHPIKDYCDPSGIAQRDTGKPSITVLHDKNIYPMFARSTPMERAVEIRRLMNQRIAGKPSFLIHPQNEYLIEGLAGGIQYHKKRDGTMVEEINKDGYFEHGNDALGYMVANTCMMDVDGGYGSKQGDIKIIEPKWRSSVRKIGAVDADKLRQVS